MNKILALAVAVMTAVMPSTAQTVTHNHDATKMNQFGLQEVGNGTFTPAFYYDAFHRNYQRSALSTNKLTYRTLAGVASFGQVALAEEIDSALSERAKVEAYNIADRSGGVADLAWIAEGPKVEEALERYQRNINRIIPAGGTNDDKKRWEEYYNMYSFAVKETKGAYMPNSVRKLQYINVYEDCTKQNNLLLKYIVSLSKQKEMRERLARRNERRSDVYNRDASNIAISRWREAAWSTSSNQAGSGGGEAEVANTP